MPDRLTDADVIAASLTDPAQFGLIFDRHYDAIHRYLARRGGWELAEDLAMVVFVTAFESRRRFHPGFGSEAGPWLHGIATNVFRRHARTEGRRLRAVARVPESGLIQVELDALAERLDAAALAPLLYDAIGSLPEAERDTLLLVAWADLTYDEVALALAIPIGTVRSRLHRARRRIRERIGAIGQETERHTLETLSDG
jgi:RNA polymerase sigma-70 factor (ECF subfamily)